MRTLLVAIALLVALPAATLYAAAADVSPEPQLVPAPAPAALGGKMFVFTKNAYLGDAPYFSKFAAAAGKTQVTGTTLPADLASYDCVVLPVNTALPQSDIDAVAEYAVGGGNVLAIGEWDAIPQANPVMNKVSQAAGGANRLARGAFDIGAHATTQVLPSTLTLGATQVTYAAVAEVVVGGIGFPMVKTADGKTTFVAGEQVGLGYVILSGDVNLWSDYDGGGYATASNGLLAQHACGGVVALGLPADVL